MESHMANTRGAFHRRKKNLHSSLALINQDLQKSYSWTERNWLPTKFAAGCLLWWMDSRNCGSGHCRNLQCAFSKNIGSSPVPLASGVRPNRVKGQCLCLHIMLALLLPSPLSLTLLSSTLDVSIIWMMFYLRLSVTQGELDLLTVRTCVFCLHHLCVSFISDAERPAALSKGQGSSREASRWEASVFSHSRKGIIWNYPLQKN